MYERVLEKCDFCRNFQAEQDLEDVSELRRKIRKVQKTQNEIGQLEGEIPTLEAEAQAD
jgi:hypothetical protein